MMAKQSRRSAGRKFDSSRAREPLGTARKYRVRFAIAHQYFHQLEQN
ncbi:hypothetical protein [Bradyrhizobium sp. USDA 4451]